MKYHTSELGVYGIVRWVFSKPCVPVPFPIFSWVTMADTPVVCDGLGRKSLRQ